MKKLLSLLTLLLCVCSGAWGQSVTYTCGFETGSAWGGSNTSNRALNATAARTGTQGQYGTGSKGNGRRFTSPAVSLTKNSKYYAICWVKTDVNSTAGVGIGGAASEYPFELTADTWTRIYVDYTAGSTGTKTINPTFTVGGSATFYLDDVVMYETTENAVDLTAPSSASLASATEESIVWTNGSDTGDGATGIQGTLIFKRASGSSDDLTLNDQAIYSLTPTEGPSVDQSGNWTLVSSSVASDATSYDGTFTIGDRYAIVHRDYAYNYSAPTYVTVATTDPRTALTLSFAGEGGETEVNVGETLNTVLSWTENTSSEEAEYTVSYAVTSGDAYASVDASGVITGVAMGSATITATVTAAEDATYKGGSITFDVTVKDPSYKTVTKTWDFTKEMSASDIANLTAGVENEDWTYDEANKRYSPTFSAVSSNGTYVTLEANGEPVHWVDGLLFGRPSGRIAGTNIRLDNGSRFQWNTSGAGIKILSLKKDDIITVRFGNTDGKASRTVTVDNATLSSADGSNTTATLEGTTATFVVGANGDVVIKSDQVRYFLISVTTQQLTETANVTEYGWATFNSDKALDLTGTDYAYQVTGVEGTTVALVPVTGKVAANTPLILKGTEGEATELTIPVADEGSDISGTNKLVAVTADDTSVEKVDGKTRYVLAVQEEKAVFAKINATAATLDKGQAYLELDGEVVAARLSFGFDDNETTGITSTALQPSTEQYFNLAGQRVAQPTKGLYIVNGRKVVIR